MIEKTEINEKMYELGSRRSVIREIFEYGNRRRAEIGAENVFDFSLGNPSVPAPECVAAAIRELSDSMDPVLLHGYTSAAGDLGVRKRVAEYLRATHGAEVSYEGVYMTCGAAASLCISLSAIISSGEDEIVTFTPFFPEYRVFVEAAGGRLVAAECSPSDFQIDFERLSDALNPNTRAVIINSPNNPSGVVFSESTVKRLCAMLRERSEEYGRVIYLIADEPYRELVYDGKSVPFLMNYYDNTIVCYSFSKALSLPGERIGYIAVCSRAHHAQRLFAAINGAGRALGYVCAPSMFQRIAAMCLGRTSDVSVYGKNRDLLYGALTKFGFSCIYPDGAFYLFVKSPEPDAVKFCERARAYEILAVPADDFGTPGFVRLAYCVSTRQIERSLPFFKKLAEEYGLN